MIRDPSDGSVKPATHRPTSAENWGLKTLDQKPKASTFKAMNPEQLAEHYSKFKLGYQPKEGE